MSGGFNWDGDDFLVKGNTDQTLIGNVGDRLKVDANFSTSVVGSLDSKTRVDVQTTTIGIASNITYTTIYTYSGTGFLVGFSLEFNSTNIVPRLRVDGETIFDANTIGTLNGFTSTAATNDKRQNGQGMVTAASTFDFSLRQPIRFATSVVIDARLGIGLILQNFNQGIFYIVKTT